MRSWLFVPGDSQAKMDKGLGSGADALILDLEDSVAEGNKATARATTAALIKKQAKPRRPQLWVRINALSTPHALLDLAAVMPSGPDGIFLPKPDSAAAVVELGHYLSALEANAGIEAGSTKILPIATETAAAIFNLGTYVGASPRLAGLTWGAEDLPTAVGAMVNKGEDGHYTDLCRIARTLCIAGAAAAGVPAIETVYPAFKDLDGLRAYATAGRREGFVGMMAIHPAQVPVINEVFTPSAAEIEDAQRIVDAFAAHGGGTLGLDGRMLDAPHLTRAQRILAAARR